MTTNEPAPVEQMGRFSIQERDDDMLIAEQHWQFGWRCVARRPKLMTNEEWRPEAERIVEALRIASTPTAEPDEGLVEKVQTAIVQGIYGPKFDPFAYPEAWDWCAPIARAVLSAATPSIRAKALKDAYRAGHRDGRCGSTLFEEDEHYRQYLCSLAGEQSS